MAVKAALEAVRTRGQCFPVSLEIHLCSVLYPVEAVWDSGDVKAMSSFFTAKNSRCFGLWQVQVISKDETVFMKTQRNWAQI